MNTLEPWARVTIGLVGGAALGCLYFGGLWLTVRRLQKASPVQFLASFVARMVMLAIGIYWLAAGDWRSIVACLAGILISRQVIIRQVQRGLRNEAG